VINFIKGCFLLNNKITVREDAHPLNISTSSFPVTARIMHDTFWIGVYPTINESILDFVVEKIDTFALIK